MWPLTVFSKLWAKIRRKPTSPAPFSSEEQETKTSQPEQPPKDGSPTTRLMVSTNAKTLPFGELVEIFYAAPTSLVAPSPTSPVTRAQPSHDFLKAIEARRSHYSLSSVSPIPDDRIVQVIQHAITHVPSSWNSQSSRAVVLFGTEHHFFWDMVVDSLRKITSGSKLVGAEGKINNAMKAGRGTVLFFEDMQVVQDLQGRFPTYKDEFAMWSEQTSGMAQFIVWVALQEEGLGVSLQHYTKLIEADVKIHYSIPYAWKLVAQMPFGLSIADPGEKTFQPIEPRVKVFGL